MGRRNHAENRPRFSHSLQSVDFEISHYTTKPSESKLHRRNCRFTSRNSPHQLLLPRDSQDRVSCKSHFSTSYSTLRPSSRHLCSLSLLSHSHFSFSHCREGNIGLHRHCSSPLRRRVSTSHASSSRRPLRSFYFD